MSILIRDGRVIDPSQNIDSIMNVFIENDKIKYVGTRTEKADVIIDARGLIVTPGLIDMHFHIREPGRDDEESISSAVDAAVNGGFTSIACMANTDPPVDNQASAEFIYLQARRAGKANVFPIGAITKGLKGEELSEMGQLAAGGTVAFSDDGHPILNSDVIRRGLQYAKMFNKTVISHAEDKNLTANGVMNEGIVSMLLGLPGMPKAAEDIIVSRDTMLAKITDSRLHIAHISTKTSVELIKKAKIEAVKVTCEATPHHLTLTEECVKTYDPDFKMNPPLRTKEDVEALREALKDGTIDVIASDHAPHAPESKDVEFTNAPFGVIGIETMLPIVITELVNKNAVSLFETVKKMTINPAKILNIPKGTLKENADADVTIIDLNKEWIIDISKFKSKSRNCPFKNWKVKGKAIITIVGGKIFKNES